MLLRDLTKVYVSRAKEVGDPREPDKKWNYVLTAYLNLQQDINELDRKTTGEIDYSTYKARTTKQYHIEKGDGISLIDISNSENFNPDYRVIEINKIGSTYLYILEQCS